MPSAKLLSGGAAKGLVEALAPQLEAEAGCAIEGEFSAVGSMAAKLRNGFPADLLILTSTLIAELAREGLVVPGSAVDVGIVRTGVAVRAGDTVPPIGDAASLRAALLAADGVYLPDIRQSTAGIHLLEVLRSLGIAEELEARLRIFPNGATAMHELAASADRQPIGSTQETEILSTRGVTLVGPLPEGCELATTYTAAICARTQSLPQMRRIIAVLTGASGREVRAKAGFC